MNRQKSVSALVRRLHAPAPYRRIAILPVILLAAGNVGAQSSEVQFVPDVEAQFDALSERAEALGFGIGNSPDPEACKHYQGIVRSSGPGTPYFFVSRSGNETAAPGCSSGDQPGNLLIVKMASRPTHGERMRSNRLRRNTETDESLPDPADTTVNFITFDGTNGWPNYGHAGGMQLVGDVLVVPLEQPYDGGPEGTILFIDVSQPESPVLISRFNLSRKVGLVTVTPQSSGRYLMLTTGGDNETLDFFESDVAGPEGLHDSQLGWTLVDTWHESTDEDDLGNGQDWPTESTNLGCLSRGTCRHPHQTLNFVREGDLDGALYLVGVRNPGGGGGGVGQDEDKFDLYRVEKVEEDFKLRWVATKEIIAKPTSSAFHDANEPDDLANFAAASGVYVSPSGELLIYAAEHDNDGPGGTIKAGEWRHRDRVRAGSPTYFPTPVPGGPFTVPEGGSTALSGRGDPPITQAWIEMFADPGFTDRSVVIDYPDWSLDDFDNFKELDDADLVTGFSDQASSWRWYAPKGCTLRANDDDFNDSSFPGDSTRTLPGDGQVHRDPDLDDVLNDAQDDDMDDEVTSAEFFDDCDVYYSAPMEVSWDLDGDAAYETLGANATFAAAGLDGPSVHIVSMRATHPGDRSSGTIDVPIQVSNVAPVMGTLAAFDSTDLQIGFEVPVALVGLPVRVNGTFTDPGISDIQTAVLDWGDGTSDSSQAFDQFSDAARGATGIAEHAHVYLLPGTYTVSLVVTDDDGGVGTAQVAIEIVSFAAAAQAAVDLLHDVLSQGGFDSPVRQIIENALVVLEGKGGALERLEADERDQALALLTHALLKLEAVETLADVEPAELLLVQIVKSIVLLTLTEAKAAAQTPVESKKIAAAEARIADAEALLVARRLFESAETFKEAFKMLP